MYIVIDDYRNFIKFVLNANVRRRFYNVEVAPF